MDKTRRSDLLKTAADAALDVLPGDTAKYGAMLLDIARREASVDSAHALIADKFAGAILALSKEGKTSSNENLDLRQENEALREILSAIWLYVNWRYITRQLTYNQKELWADVLDSDVPEGTDEVLVDRWWRP